MSTTTGKFGWIVWTLNTDGTPRPLWSSSVASQKTIAGAVALATKTGSLRVDINIADGILS